MAANTPFSGPPGRRGPFSGRDLSFWWKAGGVAFLVAGVLWALGLVGLWSLKGPSTSSLLVVGLTQVPYATPTGTPSPTWTPWPSPTPSPTLPGAAQGFGIGVYVQVFGTQGSRLRFREAPGLSAAVRFLAQEMEVFRIEEGPVLKDGYVWWYLVAPYSPERAGWAVQDFLKPLPTTPAP